MDNPPVPVRMAKERGEGGKTLVTGPGAAVGLQEELFVWVKLNHSDLVVQQPHGSLKGSRQDVIHGQLRVVAPNLGLAGAFCRGDKVAFFSWGWKDK